MEYKNAGFTTRMFASIMDWCLVFVLLIWPIVGLNYINKGNTDINEIITMLAFYIAIIIPLSVFYQSYFVSKWGGTPGKLLFGLHVLDRETSNTINIKTAFYRYLLGYSFSGQIFGLGFFRIIKHSENLGWHDELFNTKVVAIKKPVMGYVALVMVLILIGLALFLLGTSLIS